MDYHWNNCGFLCGFLGGFRGGLLDGFRGVFLVGIVADCFVDFGGFLSEFVADCFVANFLVN